LTLNLEAETINPEPGTLLPTQVPVNEDGSFLAFGQGTSGTVTRVSSASFGKLSPRNDQSEIEIRASWSPIIKDSAEMIKHIDAWCNLLGEVAGLPPVVEGVAPISAARRRV
jgi:hypothetical protein